jgi:hypothetical protein
VGTIDTRRIVTQAYREVLHREPDAEGLKYWDEALAKGMTEAEMRATFAASPEYKEHVVERAYADILDRQSDPEGRSHYDEALRSGKLTEAGLRETLLRSAEYAARFPGLSTSPAPSGPMSLQVEGNRFKTVAGAEVKLLGIGGVCCTETAPDGTNPAKVAGWPLVSEAVLRQLAVHKGNFVHIRLGPFITDSEGPGFNAYFEMPDKHSYDLDKWNPAFWARVRALLALAHELRIYVEVDVLDGWAIKVGAEVSPFAEGRNIQHENHVGCDVLKAPPPPRFRQWVEKVVAETGEFENVLYQLGNENFVCGAAPAYEEGLVLSLRQAEANHHFPKHLIGSNTKASSVPVDYIERHASEAQRAEAQPVMVNEYDVDSMSPAAFEVEVGAARRRGTAFHLWMGQQTGAEWLESLDVIKRATEGALKPIPDVCPPLTKWGVKVHSMMTAGFQPIDFNDKRPIGVVGGYATLDSTPKFGGQPCNSEHPGICGGRKCEPKGGPEWVQTDGPNVPQHLESDGYLLRVGPLASGTYTFETHMKPGTMDQEEPTKPIPGGGPGTHGTVTFSVP